MLNDIKFLYYLFTNYTLKEIKILFEIAPLLPKMIFQKYYENNTTIASFFEDAFSTQ